MDIIKIFDIIICIWLLFGVINGFFTGLIMKAAQLAAAIAAYVGAVVFATIVSKQIAVQATSYIAYIILFLMGFILLNFILRHVIVILKIVDHIPVIGLLNRLGGAVVGFVVDFVIILMLCNIVFKCVPQDILDLCGLTNEAVSGSNLLSIFIL